LPPGPLAELNKGLLDGMEKVGKRFQANEIYILRSPRRAR
jgi:cobalamin-dependent methionine synthase I